MKIDKRTIFEIHRLNDLGWSERKTARYLRVSRPSVNKYLINPDLSPAKRSPRSSKLDAYRDLIKEFVEQDSQVKAPVVLQRLQDKGFDGKITIVRDYLQKLRGSQSSPRALFALNPHRAGKCRSTGVILDTCSIKTPSASCMHWRSSSHIVACCMWNLPIARTNRLYINAC